MQSQPLVPMKKAASMLGVDKNVLKQKLEQGTIKGERRRVGSKDKWFVYTSEVADVAASKVPNLAQQIEELARQVEETAEERITLEDLDEFFHVQGNDISFDPSVHDALDMEAAAGQARRALPALMTSQVEYFLEALTRQFAERLSTEHQERLDAERQLKDREEQVRRMPRLEAELRKSQETLKSKDATIEELQAKVADLEKQVEAKSRPWWQRWFLPK